MSAAEKLLAALNKSARHQILCCFSCPSNASALDLNKYSVQMALLCCESENRSKYCTKDLERDKTEIKNWQH